MGCCESIKNLDAQLDALSVYRMLQDKATFDKVSDLYQQARQMEYLDGMSKALSIMGITRYFAGELRAALNYYEEALSLAQSINHYALQRKNLVNISVIFLSQKLYTNALRAQLEALQVSQKIINTPKEKYKINITYSNIGLTFMKLELYDEAEKYFKMSRDYDGALNEGNLYNYAIATGNLIALYARQNRMDEASVLMTDLETATTDGSAMIRDYILRSYQGQYLHGMGQVEAAHTKFQEAFQYAVDYANGLEDAEMIEDWTRMLREASMIDDLESLMQTLETQCDTSNTSTQIDIQENYYFIAKHRGDLDKALTHLERVNALKMAFDRTNQQLLANNMIRVADMQVKNQKLVRSMVRDLLTNCYNRRILKSLCGQMHVLLGERYAFSVIMLDIDCFKQYNDHYGHVMGDEMLKQVTGTIADQLNDQHSYFIRYGGDEFTVILPSVQSGQAVRICQQIMKAIRAASIPHEHSTIAPHLTLTMGMRSFSSQDDLDLMACIDAADVELYRGKNAGRNCIFADGDKVAV